MKIAVLNNAVPFLRGGAEFLADALVGQLRSHGHQAMLVRVPFAWEPPARIIEHMAAARLLRVPSVDRVIGLKFPAYYIPHPNKCVWLLHQFRQAYDLWDTPLQGLPKTPEGMEIRNVIRQADTTYLAEANKIWTNSRVTSERLQTFNGLSSEVLHPPLLNTEQFKCREYGDYILAPGRVNEAKRQLLLVEAMQFCRSDIKLVIAGKPETAAYAESIKKTIKRKQLQNKVTFIDRFIEEEEKLRLLGGALAVAYIPYDEDSYGYVTLESFLCRKAVITCDDSGGILEFVKDQGTGRICRPDAAILAEAMDWLCRERRIAQSLGQAGRAFAESLALSWDRVVRVLTT